MREFRANSVYEALVYMDNNYIFEKETAIGEHSEENNENMKIREE